MKILYLWNTAGVFTPVAEWLIDNGHDAKIVHRTSFDIYKQTSKSRAAVMVGRALHFYTTALKLIRSFKPDIIHISSSVKMLVLARALAWRTPIIFTYHGSDARNPTGKPHPQVSGLADYIHVTTPDLKPYGNWIDRPIDPAFYYRGGRQKGTALLFYKSHFFVDNRSVAQEWCNERGIKLMVLDDSHPQFPIPNDLMPIVLSKCEFYLDWKNQKDELYALSKTALEALACGCKVIHDSDTEHIIYPHNFQNVGVEPYITLYKSLPKSSWSVSVRRSLTKTIRYLIGFWRIEKYG